MGKDPGSMYAFCFTIPYGFVLMLGGVIGFLKGSTVSLVMGAGLGALITAMGFRSVSSHKKRLDHHTGDWAHLLPHLRDQRDDVSPLRQDRRHHASPADMCPLDGYEFISDLPVGSTAATQIS